MKKSATAWALVGVAAGFSGLATSYLTARAMSLRLSPVTAVAELVARLTPGDLVESAISTFGTNDKPLLVTGVLVVLTVVFAVLGRLARRAWWMPVVGFAALGGVGAWAMLSANGATVVDLLPVAVGFVTWVVTLALVTERLRALEALPEAERYGERYQRSRRSVLAAAGGVAGIAVASAAFGKVAGRAREQVEQSRRLLRLPATTPKVPASASSGVEGAAPWATSAEDFYLIDTTFTKPTIKPSQWRLRIHGMVDREIELGFDDLVDRELTEAWVTLNCVSNPVGGDYIGNAWWSGVRLAPILAEAGVQEGADAVLQTSDDGWTCGTPLTALTDDRDAMLAVAMNGEPLPIEHGFPVRTLVPGLYGYVSACKWVVDMEVTRFDDIEAYWTQRGWGEMGPVKIASRIDVPRSGEAVRGPDVTLAGSAWKQHTGIERVEVSVDGGAWQAAELAGTPSDDTWAQWRLDLSLDPGDHGARVRAVGKDGDVQTGVQRDVLPDGATGWDEVTFSVRG